MPAGRRKLATGLIALAATISLAAQAQNAEPPKWGPHIDLEGKAGNQRHLGEADLFIPVIQNDRSLLFANIRSRADTNDSYEGNFGLGARHMMGAGWNLGAYGYFDRRRTENDGNFNQVTVGTEALGVKALGQEWDARVNGYIPVGRKVRLVDSLSTAEVSGASVIFRGGEEHSMAGFDAELGWRVPVTAPDSGLNLRLYGGGYRFWSTESSAVHDVQGPRGRAELVFDQIPVLWEGSRFSLGAEGQHDDPRGTQAFLSARLRIPLQVFGKPSSKLTAQERRMADPIVRDIDIVSQAGAYGAQETATASNGGAITVLNSSTTTGANLQTAVTNAGANSTVVLSGTFSTTSTITLQAGQTVMGAGSLTVRSPSGRTVSFTPSSGATIAATNTFATTGAVTMANNTTLKGMTITQNTGAGASPYGVEISNLSNVSLINNSITSTGINGNSLGTFIDASSNVTVSGNTISATRVAATAIAFYMRNSSGTVSGNTLSATGTTPYAAYLVYQAGNTLTLNSGSTGNVFSAGSCGSIAGGTINGSLGYGTSSTCP